MKSLKLEILLRMLLLWDTHHLDVFEVNNEIDVLVHLQEISYSRVNHPDEIFNIGEKHDLKIISIDNEKLQIGCSITTFARSIWTYWKLPNCGKYRLKLIRLLTTAVFALNPLSTLLHSRNELDKEKYST